MLRSVLLIALAISIVASVAGAAILLRAALRLRRRIVRLADATTAASALVARTDELDALITRIRGQIALVRSLVRMPG
jgi:predicted RNA-binding Zn ribbon-like protein